jgi:hypothetical protein
MSGLEKNSPSRFTVPPVKTLARTCLQSPLSTQGLKECTIIRAFPDSNPWMTAEARLYRGPLQEKPLTLAHKSVSSLLIRLSLPPLMARMWTHSFQVLGRSNSGRKGSFPWQTSPSDVVARARRVSGRVRGQRITHGRFGPSFPVTAQAPAHATNGGDLLQSAIQVFCLLPACAS